MSKKKTYAIIAIISSVALCIVGTFAWTNFNSSIINSFVGQGLDGGDNGEVRVRAPGGTLHNDYEEGKPYRDIYIENWGTEPMIVRIRLAEYMEIGSGAGDVNGSENNQAVSLVSGATLNDVETWTPFDGNLDEVEIRANTDYESFRDYWRWTMGGQKFFFPAPYELRGTVDENGVDFVSTRSPAFISGSALDLAKQTIYPDAEVKTMAQWVSEGEPVGNFWIVDTDGFSYWASPLEPREATSLLLHKVELIENPTYDYFYGIHVDGQMATVNDAPDNYERFLYNASDEAKRLINMLANEIRADVEYNWLTEEMIREAEEAVTQELRARIALIEREAEEFFSDLTFERVWDMLLYEHPYRFEQMTENEILAKRQEREERHEAWVLFMEREGFIDHDLMDSSGTVQHELRLRHLINVLSRADGMSWSDILEVTTTGDEAYADALLAFSDVDLAMKRDAFRHYSWNFYATRRTSEDSARIYTTNRKLASYMMRQHPDLTADNALVMRNFYFDFTFQDWDDHFSGEAGRNALMDLWNSEQGRQDGSDYSLSLQFHSSNGRFIHLFNNGVLIRNNSKAQLTLLRRNIIWGYRLFRPVPPTAPMLTPPLRTPTVTPRPATPTVTPITRTPTSTPWSIGITPTVTPRPATPMATPTRTPTSTPWSVGITPTVTPRPATPTVTPTRTPPRIPGLPSNPATIVEIVVAFRTPCSVALRLRQERGDYSLNDLPGNTFEEQALYAHDSFMSQLAEITTPAMEAQIDIYSRHHALFNGVFMRVPAGFAQQIAELPEVASVRLNIRFSTF